jgi:uncharacterized membrane protein
MAGIGFELRKILRRNSLLSLMQAYSFAAVISSGPWILSIFGILIIGMLNYTVAVPGLYIVQFQVSVTYLIACSLILTGAIQLAYTRYTADRLFEKNISAIGASFYSVTLIVTVVSGALCLPCIVFLFPQQSVLFRLLFLASFVVLSNIWIATIFLSGMKRYGQIVWLYALGYSITVGVAALLRGAQLEGLMAGFLLGQSCMLFGMLVMIGRDFPAGQLMDFGFFKRRAMYPSLMLIGLFYNLAVWIDKFIFWFNPDTSQAIIGPLRASVIYDMPVFLAYLAIIPGMAIFLMRMETDFVEDYDAFYRAVRTGGSLETIERARNGMVATIRLGIFEIVKVQTLAVLFLLVAGETVLSWMGISTLYLPLLYIDVIGAGLQIVLLGQLNVFFYLDKRTIVLRLCAAFVVLNALFTAISLKLGPAFYGYGFAVALLCVVLAAFIALSRKLEMLEYDTFMLQ